VEDHGMAEKLSILYSGVFVQTEKKWDASKNGPV